jgi:hypothetical protein
MLETSQAGHVGDALASASSLIRRRLLTIVLRNLPPQQRQQQPHDPTGVGIDHQLQPRARRSHQRKRRPRLHGERPNRDSTVELLIGWYSMTSMLPSTRRPRSVRTSRAVIPIPIGPGEVLVMR